MPQITESAYWDLYEVVRADVEAAVTAFHTFVEIHRLASSEPEIDRHIQRFPRFWRTTTYSLQMTYFIALGRLFDKRKDTHSIRHFIDVTVENPWIFSRPQLLKRKQSIRSHKNDEPQWLRDYVGRAWEPSKQDLEILQSDISTWEDKYKAVYKPIRDNVIAHSARRLDAPAIQALFALTLVDEMKDMLRDLQTLLSRTWELAWNATPPTRYEFSYHLNYVRDVTEATEDFIKAVDPKARPRQRRTFLTSYAGS